MFKSLSGKWLLIIPVVIIVILALILTPVIMKAIESTQPPKTGVNPSETVTVDNRGVEVEPQPTDSSSPSASPSTKPTPLPSPTTADFINSVQKSARYLSDSNNQPKFGILRVQEPLDGWYVVTIRVTGAGQTGKVILRQTANPDNPLTVVAGPGTAFPRDQVYLPEKVRDIL